MKTGLGKKTKGKLNTFLLFLGLSVMFWFLTKFSKDHINDVQAQMHLIGVPEGNMLIGNDKIPVRIQMHGTGFDYLYYSFKEPTFEVNILASAVENEGSWVLPRIEANILASKQLDREVEVLLPSRGYTISLETLATKKVAVTIKANVTFDEGFSPTDLYQVVPDSVLVSGPKSIIDTIQNINTVTKTYANVSQNIDDILPLVIIEGSGLRIVPEEVAFNLSVAEYIEDSRVVPIQLINVPSNTQVQLFPSSVTVSYVIDFDNYKKILANDFKVVLDLSKAREDSNVLAPELISYPKTAKNVTLNTAQVEFVFIQ